MNDLEVRVGFHLQSRAAGGGGVDLSGTQRAVAVPLGDGDTPGGIAAWPNPEGAEIIVTALILRVDTAPTTPGGNNVAQVGLAADAVSVGTVFSGILALDQSPVPALVAWNGRAIFAADGGSAAGLAGYAYIAYQRAA
jgi:hypothetical protein